MKRNVVFLLLVFLLVKTPGTKAQQYIYNYNVAVKQQENYINFPFAGGLNNPQFSPIDINNDGVEDIYIFDRTGNKSLVLINEGSFDEVNYLYWNQYQSIFPSLQNWVILLDYNCDGIQDIITGFDTGIKTYLGSFSGSYSFIEDLIKLQFTEAGFNFDLPVGYIDIPGFADINFDGDIDVLSFNLAGGIVDYYENRQVENGLDCGTWALEHINSCWGNFYESGITYSVDLNYDCKGVNKTNEGVHAGSTFMIFDEDADNDMDIVLGDLAFGNLNRLENGGDKNFADIIAQDTAYPQYDKPYDLQIFPAAFLIDVNNDNKKDMLVSPNSINQSENFKNVWYYKNISADDTYIFDYQNDSLFVSDMIDLGDGAYPVFFDFNYDGLKDIIIGNYGYYNAGSYDGKLALFENSGTSTAPEFTLITRDLAGISAFDFNSLIPTFGDLDNDGDDDMLLGEEDGFIHYFKNIGPPDGPAQFILDTPNYQGIDPGQNAAPQLIDITDDGLLDLIIGEKNGNLNYYENVGSPELPDFNLASEFWGGVDVRTIGSLTGYATPFLINNTKGLYELYVGCEEGSIYLYHPTIDFTGTFEKITSTFNAIDEGSFSSVHLNDINDDLLPDLVTGNKRGGITLYRDVSSTIVNDPLDAEFLLYPNPAADNIFLTAGYEINTAYIHIYSIDGKMIQNIKYPGQSNNFSVDISHLQAGLYFIKVMSVDDQIIFANKFVKF